MASRLNWEEVLNLPGQAGTSPQISAFAALWHSCYEAGEGLPKLSDIMSMAPDDFHVRYYIIERALSSDGQPTFRVRETGLKHTEAWGVDVAGKYFDQLFPSGRLERLESMADTALFEGLPSFQQGPVSLLDSDEMITERVLVPVVDDSGHEVLLGIMYWDSELRDMDHAESLAESPSERNGKADQEAPTESLQIRLEVDGAPLAVENFVATEAASDEERFAAALAPLLRKMRAGLTVNMGRATASMMRIIELRLDVQVAASLSLLPIEDDESFVSGLAPYLEAFRSGIVRAAESAEATPGELRKWRVRPRYQSFIGFKLQRASLLLGRDMVDTLQSELDVSVPEMRVIATLGQDGMQTISDASEKTMMDRAQVSRTLTKLKQKNLVEKFTDRHDRRITWLSLTEAGEDKWEEIYPVLRQRNDALIKDISTQDLRAFLRVLDALSAQIDPPIEDDKSRLVLDQTDA